MSDPAKEEAKLKNTKSCKEHHGTMTQGEWEEQRLKNTKSRKKQCQNMPEEKRERIKAYDRE